MEIFPQFFRVSSFLTNSLLHSLAKDFFSKLCAYPPSERYDAKMALAHPWITGVGGKADVPLTRKQKLEIFNIQMELKKAV
jgi:serine/threonine protein kinase